ncbi:MAG: hypothetical protein E7257_10265 [Lachnospiraceae bacterium]|nr:hypothetical protein [Lachnospiraceae bacterium]
MKESNITAKRFMEYYGLAEDVVPERYVNSFIEEYGIKESKLENSYCDQLLLMCYEKGIEFGYNLSNIMNGVKCNKSLSEFAYQSQWIIIDFSMRFGNEVSHTEMMIIDFKDMKMYFDKKNLSSDYRKATKIADLNVLDKEKICGGFISHIDESQIRGNYGVSPQYSFIIRFVDKDKAKRTFMGDEGDNVRFPGFDEYWKTLYSTYFGEEYSV